MGDLDDSDLEGVETEGGEQEDEGAVVASEVDDAPIVKYVNKMLLDAIRGGAHARGSGSGRSAWRAHARGGSRA